MKSLKHYIAESEQWMDSPVTGDDFAINIREECLLESHIVDVTEDAVIIAADDRMLEMLESYGMLGQETVQERIRRYGAVGSNRAQGFTVAEGDIDPNRHPQTRNHGRGHDDQDQDKQHSEQDFRRVMELAGVPVHEDEPIAAPQNANANDPLLGKAVDDAAVQPMEERENGEWSKRELEVLNKAARDFERHLDSVSTPADRAFNANLVKKRMATNPLAGPKGQLPEQQGMAEGVMSDIDMDLRHIAKTQRLDALVDALRGEFGSKTAQYLHDLMDEVDQDLEQRGMATADMKKRLAMLMNRVQEIYHDQDLAEAEYRGRDVPLGKPMAGDVKKKKVYVRKPNGNVVKVEFGDKTMRIKKSNPKRRKSFRARHNCANPGPRWKARYWSCRAW